MSQQVSAKQLSPSLALRLADLYRRMEAAYDLVAGQLGFSCQACPDNCCDSYFLHHTRIEWAYLREGLAQLDPRRRELIIARARDYQRRAETALAAGIRPVIMCPLNEAGLCGLYQYRLMLCRLHGVPSTLSFPNGQVKKFSGCFRCQELIAGRLAIPEVERTSLLRELAELERLMPSGPNPLAVKVQKNIAEMILTELP